MQFPAALLFDLDGTLVDSAPDIAAALNLALREHGLPPASLSEARAWIGGGAPILVERALEALKPGHDLAFREPFLATLLTFYVTENGRHGAPYPGAVDTLRALAERDLALACVTNKPAALAEDLLEQYGMPINTVVGGETVGVRKPSPEPLLHACRQLSVAPETAWMIGDSAADAAGARNAGCAFIWVDYGYHQGDTAATLRPDATISSFDALLALVDRAAAAGC